MRASTRRRITLALIGLLVLVLIGWFVQDAVDGAPHESSLRWHGVSSVDNFVTAETSY